MTAQASFSTIIHCEFREPDKLRLSMMEFDNFSTLTFHIRANQSDSENIVDVFLPASMAPQLTRAVDAFNAAMAEQETENVA